MNRHAHIVICLIIMVAGISGWTFMEINGHTAGPFPILVGFSFGWMGNLVSRGPSD